MGNRINYTVSDLESQCINIYGSNVGMIAQDLSSGKNQMLPDRSAFVLAVAKLFDVSEVSNSKVYSFGTGCGEENVDDANVFINYVGQSPSAPNNTESSIPALLPIDSRQILTINSNTTPNGATGDKIFLNVLANPQSTATISINNDSRQGQVFLVIYDAASGQALTSLHSKSNDLSFTVAQDVWVVPMLKPMASEDQRSTTILFEVGDPKRNGKVIAEEEGDE